MYREMNPDRMARDRLLSSTFRQAEREVIDRHRAEFRETLAKIREAAGIEHRPRGRKKGDPVGGMNGVSGDALTEPSSALIVGQLTDEEKRKVQGLVIDNMRSIEDAKNLLITLGLFFKVGSNEGEA